MKDTNQGWTGKLKTLLKDNGADIIGIGNMSGVENCQYETGISVGVALPKNVILDLRKAPTVEYYEVYHSLNARLNKIVSAGEDFLKEKGFDAYAQTTDRVKISEEKISPIPHKTVATRAGIGWIGKNCLLVTPQFGSAIRLSSILTNAPLIYSRAINDSECGQCKICVKECPAQALYGSLWNASIKRDKILDYRKCYKKQMEIMEENTGIVTDLCGKCFAVCKYTERYLSN